MDEELLKQVKEAAREGAKEGAIEGIKEAPDPAQSIKVVRSGGGFLSGLLSGVLGKVIGWVALIAIIFFAVSSLNPLNKIKDQMGREEDVTEHDMTLENDGIFGYTTADFAEAVLGDQSRLEKLEVLSQQVDDIATLTDTGFANLKFLTKTQLVTYHGTATYSVDLSELTQDDFSYDEDSDTLTVTIPHAVLEPINIQSSDIEFGDVDRGLLAWGDMDITPEEMQEVQTQAQEKMKEKLEENNVIEDADRFAQLSVWELYKPVIKGIHEKTSLEVEFREQ